MKEGLLGICEERKEGRKGGQHLSETKDWRKGSVKGGCKHGQTPEENRRREANELQAGERPNRDYRATNALLAAGSQGIPRLRGGRKKGGPKSQNLTRENEPRQN